MTSAPDGRGPRIGRAAAASGLGVLVALAAHLAGGGTAPSLGAVLVLAVLLQPLALLLAGRHHRLARQAAIVALGQAGVHLLVALGPAASPVDAMPSGMDHMAAMPALADPHAHPSGPMLGWHAVAWTLTTLAWRWGADALRRIAAVLQRTVARLRRAGAGPSLPRVPRPAPPVAAAPRTLLLLRATPRRGPPAPA